MKSSLQLLSSKLLHDLSNILDENLLYVGWELVCEGIMAWVSIEGIMAGVDIEGIMAWVDVLS